MVYTETKIERDFFTMIKASALGQEIKGGVYRDEMRANNAKTEDVVVKFIAGTDEQIQAGIVVCRIYVPDLLQKGGKAVKDYNRIGVLQDKARGLIGCTTEYSITSDGTFSTINMEGMSQHCIVCRLKFERITD